jgi:RNA recognition motif-containing protein
MRVRRKCSKNYEKDPNVLTTPRIVEYATREQAQQAVTTLSNQNLMGRLVYVREVCYGMLTSLICDE